MTNILVPLAEGFEEIEAVTIIDILRRAGAHVVVAGLSRKIVKGSHNITITADQALTDLAADDFDMIVLPGGIPGMNHLKESDKVLEMIRALNNSGKPCAAICASPVVLEEAGITKNVNIAVHPDHAQYILNGNYTNSRTCIDELLITGQAAGSAMEFAFKLVEVLFGKDKVEEINKGVLARL